MTASGTFGGLYPQVIDADRLGAIVLKTITAQPRRGNPPPRVLETPSGLLNSIGLENPGIDAFLQKELPALPYRTRLVVNIAGETPEEFGELAARLEGQLGVAALELNLSCPNVSGGLDFSTRPEMTEKTVSLVKRRTTLPVIAKLTPNVTDVTEIARAAVAGGADALSLINTLQGMAVDWRRRRAVLGAGTGGLSGPAIKPVAVRMVWQVCSALPGVPVIGIGGISSAEDALEFLCAGARAVQVGTAGFVDPTAAIRILDDLPRLLAAEGISSVDEIVGAALPR